MAKTMYQDLTLNKKRKGQYQPLERIHLSLPPGLLTEMDQVAKRLFRSRSDYIRYALIEQLAVDNNSERNPRKTSKHLPQRMITNTGFGDVGIRPEWG